VAGISTKSGVAHLGVAQIDRWIWFNCRFSSILW